MIWVTLNISFFLFVNFFIYGKITFAVFASVIICFKSQFHLLPNEDYQHKSCNLVLENHVKNLLAVKFNRLTAYDLENQFVLTITVFLCNSDLRRFPKD